MRSLPLVSTSIWLLAYHSHTCYGEYYSVKYTMEVSEGERLQEGIIISEYTKCQLCLIAMAGAKGVSLKRIEPLRITFTVTSSHLGFQRGRNHCSDVCRNLIAGQLASPVTVSTGHTESTPHVSKKKQKEEKLVCLTQSYWHATDDCRSCIREVMDSKNIGEFLFIKDGTVYFVHVLRTLNYRPDHASRNCEKTRACSKLGFLKYPDDLCQAVHEKRVSTSGHSAKRLTMKLPFLGIQKSGKTQQQKMHFYCLEVTPQPDTSSEGLSRHERIILCMKCLERTVAGFVHWLKVDAFFEPSAFILIGSRRDLTNWNICRMDCYSVQNTLVDKCYRDYQAQFDPSPIGDQIFVHVATEDKNYFFPDYYSDCLVAHYHYEHVEECRRCLKSSFEVRVDPLSEITSLITTRNAQGKNFRECISFSNTPACDKLVFVPDQICMYEHETPPRSEQIPSAGSTHPRRELSWWHKFRKPKTPETSSAGILSTHQGQVVTIVMATYHTDECLKCLALVHEVLIISTAKRYVWMIDSNRESPACNCETIDERSRLENLDIHSLRAISALEVYAYIHLSDFWIGKLHPFNIAPYRLPKNLQWTREDTL
ncbi:unnamed protein product [Albugo candida]|uniref:Uncharacterized protein n=1 Tax=Albugo candida TaxID=65357 RepID=A0A024GJX8_9STRA|nr:unnamed protein product [Albugo candida]|eukprot:CCI47018.1 unnamed protein product [Albugo candida]